jgi:hypothetical protein
MNLLMELLVGLLVGLYSIEAPSLAVMVGILSSCKQKVYLL